MNEDQFIKEHKQAQEDFQFTDPSNEFRGKFILHPDIHDDADFSHIDKNSIITYLKDNPKVEFSEVEQLRAYDDGLHVLNNTKNFKIITIQKQIGYINTQDENGNVIRKPVFEEEEQRKSLFPLTYHYLKARRYSFVTTASARMGYRFNKSRSTILEKSETLQDKTEVKSSFGFGKRNNEV